MVFGRETKNKILAVSHFHSRSDSNQDYSESQYDPNTLYEDDYAPAEMHNGDQGLKLRGLTEKKRRHSSKTQVAPRPSPYQSSSSNPGGQSSTQGSYYHTSSQWTPATTGAATFQQGPIQGSPPPMHNSTYAPPNQQFQNGNPNQGFVDPKAYYSYQTQGQYQYQQQQQQQPPPQQPQNYNQGNLQNNYQYPS